MGICERNNYRDNSAGMTGDGSFWDGNRFQHGGAQRQGQADYVEVVALDACDPFGGAAWDAQSGKLFSWADFTR